MLDVAHQRSNGALTVLEDWRSPANSRFTRSVRIVLVRRVIELFGVLPFGHRLRQLAANDVGDVGNRFRDVIFEVHRTPHTRHRLRNKAVEPMLEQSESFRRVLYGEREDQASGNKLELHVLLGLGPEGPADLLADRSDHAHPYLRWRDLTCKQSARH